MGGKVEAGHIQGSQIFFDLELKLSWVRLREEGKKGRKGEWERKRESCHFKPLSLAIKLLQ